MTRRTTTLLLVAAGLAVVAALATNVVPVSQILAQRAEVTEARSELARIEAENAVLAARVEDLQSPAEVERIARERLGYVRPGEEAYVVVDPTGPESTVPAAEDPADESLLDRVWEFVTGSDLAG